LDGAGGTHFVVAQADAEATGFATTTIAGTTALAGTTLTTEAFVRAGLEIAVGHGRTPE
jgi:hypothetical protein